MSNPYPDAPETIEDLVVAYGRQPEQLASLVKSMSREHLVARPIAGKWSTLEVLAHLADSDEVLADRMKRTIAMDRPLLIGFDEGLFSTRLAYQQRDPADELAAFALTRRRLGGVLRDLPPEQWGRDAVHNERGLLTLKQLVQMAVGHINHHVPFIREKKAALGLK